MEEIHIMGSRIVDPLCEVDDEFLLLLGRMGKEGARDSLAVRYYRMRKRICRNASPSICTFLDDWEVNEAFFRGYLDAETSYRFGRVSFKTYATRCIRFALANAADSKLSKTRMMVAFSLDAAQRNDDGEETTLCLADIVQDGSSPEDPRVFLDYAESLNLLHRLPKGINPVALKIVAGLCEGYRICEVAKEIGLSEKQANYHLSRYRVWAKSVLSKAGVFSS